MPSAPLNKRKRENHIESENFNPNTVLSDQPPTKRPRLKRVTDNAEELVAEQRRLIAERTLTEMTQGRAAEQAQNNAANARLRAALNSALAAGFPTVYHFLAELWQTKDQHLSSQMSKLLDTHGSDLLELMRRRRPDVVNEWATELTLAMIASEGRKLTAFLLPKSANTAELLDSWSLQSILEQAQGIAPTLCEALRRAGTSEENLDKQGPSRRDRDLIFSTAICMLAQSRSERANETQTLLAIYLLACGASRSQFEVLHHAGLCSSYSKAVRDLKDLGDQQLAKIIEISRTRAFMIVCDNLNIPFKVTEQRHNSKDHFDNGTTATLVPLYDIAFGELRLELNDIRTTRLPVLDFETVDLMPSAEQVSQLEAAMLWHIEDILFTAHPELREKLGDEIPDTPSVLPIPLHKTEQFPLPAMHIDESSLDGTIDVLDTIIRRTLKMTHEDVRKHGLIFCGGDQLIMSLLDKVSASRRQDSELLDNPSQFTKGQLGLFHTKVAADRMIINEHWGTANSKSPWSLWRMNALLGRKAISAGWKAKQLAAFRPSYELILRLALPANILDAFRIHCPNADLKNWITQVRDFASVREVATQVRDQLCSAQRVFKLRELRSVERDVPLENIILFNRDALILREFSNAIKRGDVGSIVNVLAYWALAFRGTRSMTKYADAVFHVVVSLKKMHPTIRHAFLMNWLVNLTGHINGFKEMDLMQEHQNFWAKVIYTASGSNRSWEWLNMITVSIFVLRDVIRRVQIGYKTPHNGKAHASPDTSTDIKHILNYLQQHELQTYSPDRVNNEHATPVRDLFVEGVAYANTARAYNNFRRCTTKVHLRPSGDKKPNSELDDPDGETQEDTNEDDKDIGSIQDFDDTPPLDDEEVFEGFDVGNMLRISEDMLNMLSQNE